MINQSTEIEYFQEKELTVSRWQLEDEDKENRTKNLIQPQETKSTLYKIQVEYPDYNSQTPSSSKSKELKRMIESNFRRRPKKSSDAWEEILHKCNNIKKG
ncbi:unnamed protein product [Paramecium sonneborni]|uniref:Uncharacterized protein n=1 Tax=Paramecium sonneborni TaxID=65129 RepID=A0A8S1M5V4_9CILI|nr:unnamed protein product [Paramecium sonneborni]CAD8070608.1 unnamed protein product [Paramecium sonneborni]